MSEEKPGTVLNEESALKFIKSFVDRQKRLVELLRLQVSSSVDEFNLRHSLPRYIHEGEDEWSVGVHGVGVQFSSKNTKEIIDVHVGFFDASNAFDAWRLEEYAKSLGMSDMSRKSLEIILDRLANQSKIHPHSSYTAHYVLADA